LEKERRARQEVTSFCTLTLAPACAVSAREGGLSQNPFVPYPQKGTTMRASIELDERERVVKKESRCQILRNHGLLALRTHDKKKRTGLSRITIECHGGHKSNVRLEKESAHTAHLYRRLTPASVGGKKCAASFLRTEIRLSALLALSQCGEKGESRPPPVKPYLSSPSICQLAGRLKKKKKEIMSILWILQARSCYREAQRGCIDHEGGTKGRGASFGLPFIRSA